MESMKGPNLSVPLLRPSDSETVTGLPNLSGDGPLALNLALTIAAKSRRRRYRTVERVVRLAGMLDNEGRQGG